jgi:hypothetical protein
MPWTKADAAKKNSSLKSDKERAMWVGVANNTLAAELKKGTPRAKAEAAAIKAANAATRKMHEDAVPPGQERLQEYTTSRGLSLQVNRETGLIHGVKVLGFKSRNEREYSPTAARNALGLYEGIGVNVDHVKGRERRSYHDRIGYLTAPEAQQDGIFADLRVNPKHPLAEQLFWDAEHAPHNVGLSHDATGKTTRRNGRTVVESIDTVRSVDLVAEPATTAGLFESLDQEGDDMPDDVLDLKEATVDDLKKERPDLFEHIKAELSEADALKAKDAEIVSLKAKLKEAADKEAAAKHKEAVAAELKEAKLDEPGEVFLGVLLDEQDAEKRKALIADRKRLVEAARRAGKPRSEFPGDTKDDGAYRGPKSWAAA